MWRRLKAWLGWGAPPSMKRLDAAVASNVAAQEAVQEAGEATAHAAVRQRRQAIVQRRHAQMASRGLKEQALQTSEIRQLVDDMLRGFEPRREKAKDNRPC